MLKYVSTLRFSCHLQASSKAKSTIYETASSLEYMGLSIAVKRCVALIAGIAYVFAFAPLEYSLVAFLSLACLFWLWLNTPSKKEAFLLGWLFGLGKFGVGVSWMYVSLTTFGGMPWILAGIAVLILVMGLAFFPAVVGLFQQLFSGCNAAVRVLLVISPVWVLLEWVREWLFTGLPWLSAGYSQADNILSAWASIGGVYFVSLVVVLFVSCILLFFLAHIRLAIGLAVVLSASCYVVSMQEWTISDQRSLSVKLVQGNISIWDKWNSKKSHDILNKYLALSEQGQATDLVIWPEAAAPLTIQQLPGEFIESLNQKQNTYTLFGVVEKDPLTGAYYNSVAATQKDGDFAFYRKIHLVPFGEFLPLKFLLQWLLNYLHIPMSDFSAYDQYQKPIDVKGIKIGVSICYEDAFANVIRASLPQSDILVNVSEDAWFGNSLAPHQRLQMAQMRAIENARSLVRVSNNGLSAVINHKGEVIKIAPQFETTVFDAQVEIRNGITPFSLWGHKLVLSVLGLLFLCALVILNKSLARTSYHPS